MRDDNQIINVHSAAIHIENKVGLKARLAWYYMFYKAFPNLKDKNSFTITIGELKKAIGYTSKNNKALKDSLSELSRAEIEWNIFGKDSNFEWGITHLLSECRIKTESNIIYYEYSSFVKERLRDPEMYAKINLLISKEFKSKHSLSLYCLALDYLFIKNNYGEKTIAIEDLRKYLGLKDSEYLTSGEVYKHIIKRSEKEINLNSDLNIEIEALRGERLKITGFKFKMSIKEKFLSLYNPKKEAVNTKVTKQLSFFETAHTKDIEISKSIKKDTKNLVKITNEKLRSFYAENNISMTTKTVQDKLKELQETFQDRFENYLLFLMNYTHREDNRITIKNLSGFYIGLIKDDSQMENYLLQYQKHKEQEQNTLTKINKLIEIELENKYESFLVNDFEVYINKNIKKLENKIVEILKNNIKPGEFFYAILQRNNSGVIDISLITEAKESTKMTCLGYLKKHEKELNYKKLSFDEWKTKNITEKDIEALREGISKSLKNQ